jgi:hypothetical protein
MCLALVPFMTLLTYYCFGNQKMEEGYPGEKASLMTRVNRNIVALLEG